MAWTTFSSTTTATINPITSAESPGYVGLKLDIRGVGFVGEMAVDIKYDDIPVATTTVGSDGSFITSLDVPASKSGYHTISLTDGTNTKEFTFILEHTPPSIPRPLKPEMNIKADAETTFDWEPVSDPSGVTYTLQIATKENFSEDSIVLEKSGFTQSEYTLTKEDRLRPVSKDEPYYWHIRAVDGASNEGRWSGTGSFYVGGIFLSQPVIYSLFGVGSLLFGALLFWLGRKSAYRRYGSSGET
jgi:hypothetical protein